MTDRQQAPPYPLRMSDDLRERMKQAAAGAGRSMNAEILHRLEQSFVPHTGLTRAQVIAVVKATLDELAKRKR